MSIRGILGAGRQGLLAHRGALQITSTNVANAQTPGYTRRRPELETVAPPHDGPRLGGGVRISGARRLVDEGLEAQLLAERQGRAQAQGLAEGLARIEGALDLLGSAGPSAALSRFFAAVEDVASRPEEPATRAAAVDAAEALASVLREADQRLADVQRESDRAVAGAVEEVNELARGIAALNRDIARLETGDRPTASALRDQRGVLLGDLAELVEFTTSEDDRGRISVYTAGLPLVDGESAGGLEAAPASAPPLDDPTFAHVFYTAGGGRTGPITGELSGGSLGAALSLRDDRVPAYREALDRFAFTLATRVNDVHAQGRGLLDDTSRPLFVDGTTGSAPAQVDGAAAALAVQADLRADARHFAAGRPSTGPAEPSDNTNALALAALAGDASQPFYALGDAPGAPSAPPQSPGGFLDGLAGQLGAERQSADRAFQRAEQALGAVQDQRDSVSAVSLDEELANLAAFERAFQASARLVATADEMFEVLLQI